MKPDIFDLSISKDKVLLEKLRADGAIRHSIDTYESQLVELYAIEHPEIALTPEIKSRTESYVRSLGDLSTQGRWVYFPWSSTVIHVLEDESFQKVRTARNRHLISNEEQKKFYDAVIGIAGLSVGNSVALAIVLQGGARRIKIADHDTLELSNLNRIRAGIDALGVPKVDITARQIYALNPYAVVETYPDGLTPENINTFFDDLTIVIDEIDNLAVKMEIREQAKKRKLPVLMATDNDKSGVVDVERYDLDNTLAYLHERLGSTAKDDLLKLDKRGVGRTIAQFVGLENHTEPMLRSLREMGKSIVSWPQLGGVALLNGALVAYCALRVANGAPLIDNRAIVNLDKILNPAFDTPSETEKREGAIAAFKKILGLA